MEIDLKVSDDYCQGNSHALEPVDPEEYSLPLEDRRVHKKTIRVKRGKNK